MARGHRTLSSTQLSTRGAPTPAAVEAVCQSLAAQPVGATIHFHLEQTLESLEVSSPEVGDATGLGWVWTIDGPADDPLSVTAPTDANDQALAAVLARWAHEHLGRGDLRFVRTPSAAHTMRRVAVRPISDPESVRVRLARAGSALAAAD